jgi:hypothetical protein
VIDIPCLKDWKLLFSGPAESPYSVLGLSGRALLSGKLLTSKELINLPHLRRGIYIVKINDYYRCVFLKQSGKVNNYHKFGELIYPFHKN